MGKRKMVEKGIPEYTKITISLHDDLRKHVIILEL